MVYFLLPVRRMLSYPRKLSINELAVGKMEIALFYHLISPWGIHLSLIYNPAIEVIKRQEK